MGKGDWRRPPAVDGETLRSNYERTFGRTETAEPRKVRAVPGGAAIPFERFETLPGLLQVIRWNGLKAFVKCYDEEAEEVIVEWVT